MKFFATQFFKCAALLFAVSLAVFALVSASPIDPVQANIGQAAYTAMSPEKRAALAELWGAGEPFLQRYAEWLTGALQGDFGTSLRYNMPVLQVIATRAANTLLLMAIAWVASGVIGFALGVLAGAKRATWIDRAVSGYCFLLASTPTFWLALLALVIFSVQLGWFPLGFSTPIGKSAADVTLADALHHVALPACVLALTGVANTALHTREKTIDIMNGDFIRASIARGATPARALLRHGLRNIALPAITLQFASIAEIFSGSVLVEQVFSYPGLGQAAVTAGLGGDAPLLVGIAMTSAAIVFCGNLCANLLYAAIDPRLRKPRKFNVCEGEGEGEGEGDSPAAMPAERSVSLGAASQNCEAVDAGDEYFSQSENYTSPSSDASHPPDPHTPCPGKPVHIGNSKTAFNSPTPTTFHMPELSRFGGRRWALIVCASCAVALVVIFVAGLVLEPAATSTDLAQKLLPPSPLHIFGTDSLGRDMFARTLAGLSTSVGLGIVAAAVSGMIALVLGVASALGPKWVGGVVTFLIDLMLSIPHIVCLLLISYALGRGFWGVAVGIALTHWASLARVIRAEVLQVRGSDFVGIASKLGRTRMQVARTHILAAVTPQFITGLVLMFPHAILHEASITFLGFGLAAEAPAIGVILSESMSYLSLGMWWLAVFPGLALLICVALFNAAGRALRTISDPATTQL